MNPCCSAQLCRCTTVQVRSHRCGGRHVNRSVPARASAGKFQQSLTKQAAPEASGISDAHVVPTAQCAFAAQALAARACCQAWSQTRRTGDGEYFHCIPQLRPLTQLPIGLVLAARQGSLLDPKPAVWPAASGLGHCF